MAQEKTMIPQFIAGWIVTVKTTGVKKQNSFGYYEERQPRMTCTA